MAVAIKRYTSEAAQRRGVKRRQRTFPTDEAATAAAKRYLTDPDVKAVWAYADGGLLLFKATREENAHGA